MSDNQPSELETIELVDPESVTVVPSNTLPKDNMRLPPSTYVIIAVVIVLLICFPFFSQSGPDLISTIYLGCALALGVLLAIFASVKQRWWLYVSTVVILIANGAFLAGLTRSPELLVVLLPLGIAIPVVATLEVVKLKWGRFSRAVDLNKSFSEGLQFKISHLLIMTTVVAILIAILQSIAPAFRGGPSSMYYILSMIVVLLSTIALVNVWAVLGQKIKWRIWLSLLVAALVLAAALFGLSYLNRIRDRDFMLWGGMTVITWSTSLLQLFLFRREGYRFVRR